MTRTAAAILILLLAAVSGAEAQTRARTFASNVAYVEVGGITAFEGGAYTVNYERQIMPRAYARIGAFYGTVDGDENLLVPIMLNLLLTGERTGHVELGVGVRWDIMDVSKEVRRAVSVGHRWQRPGSALVIRAGGAFDVGEGWSLYPMPSISLGYAF